MNGAAINKARVERDRRRSSKPHSASRITLTRPVREAVSTTAKTNATNRAAAQRAPRRPSRPSCSKATAAMHDHSSRLLRWLGWRRLPTARPGLPDAAIQSPSHQPGAKTCIRATITLSTPAATQAQQKAAKRSTAAPRAHAPAPPAVSTAAAPSEPIADKARPVGKAPGPHDHAAVSASKPNAASKGAGPRRRKAGSDTTTKAAHKPKAKAWLRKVGEGETL